MKLRKKLNLAGIISFFLGAVTLFLAFFIEDAVGSVLFQMTSVLCIFTSAALAVVCVIVKKRKHKKKRVRYSKSERTEMAPYIPPEGAKEITTPIKDETPEERTCQVYTVTPRLSHKKRRKHKS